MNNTFLIENCQVVTASCFSERYQILEFVGNGIQGEVWKALRVSSNEIVAVKRIKKRSKSTIMSEITALRSISHPGVLRLEKVLQDENYVYLATEFCEKTLDDHLIASGNSINIHAILRIMLQVLTTVRHIHGKGVFHRDIHGANIMVHDDRVVLIDFGMCTVLSLDSIRWYLEGLRKKDMVSCGILLEEMLDMYFPENESGCPSAAAAYREGLMKAKMTREYLGLHAISADKPIEMIESALQIVTKSKHN